MILGVDLTYLSRDQTGTVQEKESPMGIRARPSLTAPFLLADDCCACLVQYSESQSRFWRSCQLLALIFRALSAAAKRFVSCCVQTYMLVLLVVIDVGVQILPSCIGSTSLCQRCLRLRDRPVYISRCLFSFRSFTRGQLIPSLGASKIPATSTCK